MESIIYERISDKRERILTLWQAAVLPQSYGLPLKDVSHTSSVAPADYLLKEETEVLLDWLISNEEAVEARHSLQEICRLKAVQAVNPSEALGFIFDLKDIVRLVLNDEELTCSKAEEYRELDKRIDQLMLLAFDEYSDCREHIMEIRIDEIRRLGSRSA